MRTPLQEMFDQLKAAKKDDYGLAFAIDMLLENEQAMLEKEKEVIENAVSRGWDYNEDGYVRWMGEKYYNETFNTKEK
jgi:predicted Zn-dependent peptidase